MWGSDSTVSPGEARANKLVFMISQTDLTFIFKVNSPCFFVSFPQKGNDTFLASGVNYLHRSHNGDTILSE